MSHRIVVVGEAAGDFAVARELIDQTLLRSNRRFEEAKIDTYRTYLGPSVNQPFVPLGSVKKAAATDYRLTSRGQFDNDWPRDNLAKKIRSAIHLCVSIDPDAYIVIVKDTDNDDARRDTLRQIAPLLEKMPVVFGVIHTELECWLLAGFDPEDDGERERLAEVCRGKFPPGVGFNPCVKSHDLTATQKEDEKNSPKRVLRHLTGEQQPNVGNELTSRSRTCLHRDRHAVLKARGTENGLADFLRDIEQRLIVGVFGVRVATN